MSNIEIWEKHLDKTEFYMEKVILERGVFFRKREIENNGGTFLITISFFEEDTHIDLRILNVAKITNPLKKESLHALINELNDTYKLSKFVEYEYEVSVAHTMLVNPGELDSEKLFQTLIVLNNNAKEAYPKLMKLQWS